MKIKAKLPNSVKFVKWFTNKKDLPKENDIWVVLCKNKKTKEEWFTFAEFIPIRIPKCKIDFDKWMILGSIFNESFARGSKDNWFDVIAWSKLENN